ncbi:hypothetical protein GF407_17220 [candidate division KSB1 bacterium]|nr:hypothetical protein [candidate division KSB1 bacterium]
MRSDFEELYIYSRRLGLQVILFTNATLITENIARLLAEIPPGKPIEVTSYGMSATSYESVTRRKGSFTTFRSGIDHLIRYNVTLFIKLAILPPNLYELDKAEQWARSISRNHEYPACVVALDLRSRRDSAQKNNSICSMRMPPEKVVEILGRNNGYRKEMLQFCQRFTGTKSDKLFNCNIGRGICVDAYGNAKGCLSLQVPSMLYSLEKGSLRKALQDYFPDFVERKAHNPTYLQQCAHCVLRGLCVQCPAKSWSEYGTLDTPVDYYCRITHEHAYFLGLMQRGEKGWQIINWHDRINKAKCKLEVF